MSRARLDAARTGREDAHDPAARVIVWAEPSERVGWVTVLEEPVRGLRRGPVHFVQMVWRSTQGRARDTGGVGPHVGALRTRTTTERSSTT